MRNYIHEQIMIFIIDLTIKAEVAVQAVIFTSQKPPKPRFRDTKIQNFPGWEPLYASAFLFCPGINSDSDPPLCEW